MGIGNNTVQQRWDSTSEIILLFNVSDKYYYQNYLVNIYLFQPLNVKHYDC